MGSVAVAQGLSYRRACGIFLDLGSKPCPLLWASGFLTPEHQGSRYTLFFYHLALVSCTGSGACQSPGSTFLQSFIHWVSVGGGLLPSRSVTERWELTLVGQEHGACDWCLVVGNQRSRHFVVYRTIITKQMKAYPVRSAKSCCCC